MRIAAALFAFVTGIAGGLTSGAAAESGSTMFVIDGSGSMWGRFEADKRAKIDVVRDLLRSKIEASEGQAVGLTSFGHRRRGDCSDVEVIAEPATDSAPVLEPLAKLNPRGKGPLVGALRQAVGALGPNRPASLIVVGDGADNCQQDACAAAKEIASSAAGVAIHMIAIGVDPGDVPRLSCVADATGGTFHDVQDSVALALAIDAATAVAMKTPSAPAPSAPAPTSQLPAKPTDAALEASVSLASGGQPITAPVRWRIFKAGGSDVLAESDSPTLSARLDPGPYDIDAETSGIRVKQPVTIEAGRPVTLVIPLNAARLTITAKADKVTAAAQPLITIEPQTPGKSETANTLIGRRGISTQIVPAGSYLVTLADGTARQQKSVTLAAGADTTVDFALGTGRVELSAGLREDGGAIEDVTFAISEDDPDSPDGRRQVARSRSPTPQFTLPAGTYYVTARSGDGEVRERIAVGAGDVVKRALILPLVPVKISALIGTTPATASHGVVYRVTALDGDRREVARSVLTEMTLNVMPGRYRIAAHLDAHHLKVAEEVVVEAGKASSVVLKFDAGEVSLKPAAGQAPGSGEAYWEIIDSKGKAVWRSMTTEATALLAPGRYAVRLDVRDKRTEAAFEVRSGEKKVVQVGQH
jgi:Ca-activated chloride channel homolog